MRIPTGMVLTCGFLAAASLAVAQPPGGLREGPRESADDFVARMMEFDKEPKKQRDGLQKEGDARLTKILKDEQRKTLQEMRSGFGRPGGPPGGPGGPPGGPGGPPPGGRPPGGPPPGEQP